MATISGGTMTVTLTAGSNDSNGVATNLTNVINNLLAQGSLAFVPSASSNPPTGNGAFIDSVGGGVLALGPAESTLLVKDGVAGTVLGSGGQGQKVLVGASSIGFNTGGGSGTYVSGDMSELIAVPTVGGGAFTFNTGSGNDTFVLGSGMNTVNAGGGVNVMFTGGSSNLINSTGTDIINGTVGGKAGQIDTVVGGGAGTVSFIAEGAKNLVFSGGAGTTVIFAGTGSDTVSLGSGGGYVIGGSAGNNVLTTGTTGAATLFGGGSGDVLTAQGSGNNLLAAGPGNETLTGAGSTGNNVFFTGPGSAVITDGSGSDVVFAGSGASTINGGSGADLFAIVSGRAGGSVVINNFTSADRVTLQGFGTAELSNDLAKVPAGSSTLTLSDKTTITFTGITNLNSSNFV